MIRRLATILLTLILVITLSSSKASKLKFDANAIYVHQKALQSNAAFLSGSLGFCTDCFNDEVQDAVIDCLKYEALRAYKGFSCDNDSLWDNYSSLLDKAEQNFVMFWSMVSGKDVEQFGAYGVIMNEKELYPLMKWIDKHRDCINPELINRNNKFMMDMVRVMSDESAQAIDENTADSILDAIFAKQRLLVDSVRNSIKNSRKIVRPSNEAR